MINDWYDDTRKLRLKFDMISITDREFLIRYRGDKIEEDQLFEWIETVRYTKIVKMKKMNMHRFLESSRLSLLLNVRSLTRELWHFSESKLENVAHRLEVNFQMKTEEWFIPRKNKSRELKRNWNIECRFSEGMTWNFSISNLNWSSWISTATIKWWTFKYQYPLILHFTRRLNHSFYQLQMMMNMIMHIIVEDGLIYCFERGRVERVKKLKSDETVIRTLWIMIISTKKKKRVICTKSFGLMLSIIRKRFL